VAFNGSHKIWENLKVSTSANYVKTAGMGRPSTGYSDNIMSGFRQWYQTNVDLGAQKTLYEQTGKNLTWNPHSATDLTTAYWDNPYWIRYENYEKDSRSRLVGYAQLDWQITSDLKAMGHVMRWIPIVNCKKNTKLLVQDQVNLVLEEMM